MTAPGANPGPSVFPQGSSSSNGMPLLPNGTPDYGAGASGSGSGSVPVDDTGAIDVWNLPSFIADYEKQVKKPFVWDYKQPTDTSGNKAFQNPEFKKANDVLDKGSENLDVNMSAEQLMKQLSAMSQNDPMGFASVQRLLQAGNWYGSDKTIYGGWNKQTEDAFANAMVQYLKVARGAGVPITFRQFLINTANVNENLNGNTPGSGSGGAGGNLPSRPTLTDPDTLKMYAQKAAQAALGRDLNGDELDKFINEFHNQQTAAYENALHGNGDVVDKNDPRASAIQFVTQGHQQEFDQHQVQGYADAFLNMFLPNSSAAPNVNVDPSAVGY